MLSEYMRRFFRVSAQIDRLANRYETLRRRLQGASNLIQAEIGQRQLERLNIAAQAHTNLMLATTAGTLFAAIIALSSWEFLKSVFPYTIDGAAWLWERVPQVFANLFPPVI
jgi:hypothetical protein